MVGERRRQNQDSQARADSSEMMRALAAASLDALITIDSESRIIEFSPAAEKLYGYSREECLGRSVAEIVIPQRLRAAHHAGMHNYHQSGQGPVLNARSEVPSVRRDGSEFLAELTVIPLLISGQRFFTAYVRDISARKAHEEQLQAALKAAEQANEAKSRFLASISHELRTPLNAVLGALNLLQDKVHANENAGLVETAVDSGMSLLGKVDQIIEFSQLTGTDVEIRQEDFSLPAWLEDLQQQLQPLALDKGLQLIMPESAGLPSILRLDHRRLRTALLQLLDNAIKFTDHGTVRLGLHAESLADQQFRLHFSVEDTGTGMDADTQQRLFEAFYQADDSSTTRHSGLGMGLAMAQQLVRLMGGSIQVHSQSGQGTTLQFALDAAEGQSPPAAEQAPEELPERGLSGHVLVVEDVKANQLIARAMLLRAGLQVMVADNGQQALDCLQARPLDLVLMDLRMPVMDGLEATRAIRALPAPLGRIPVIAMTANVRDEDRRACVDVGMNDFLGKPIDRGRLLQCLQRWLPTDSADGGSPS